MKLCDNCRKNVATVHLTEIKKGQSEEIHLCENCARDLRVPHKPPVSVHDLLGALVDKPSPEESPSVPEDTMCEECGLTFEEFRKNPRFGCANDYKIFGRSLVPLLEKIHGSSKYIGKVPSFQDGQPVFLRELVTLRQKLKEAIKAEAYEQAASIRDRINELEELAGSPSSDLRKGASSKGKRKKGGQDLKEESSE